MLVAWNIRCTFLLGNLQAGGLVVQNVTLSRPTRQTIPAKCRAMFLVLRGYCINKNSAELVLSLETSSRRVRANAYFGWPVRNI